VATLAVYGIFVSIGIWAWLSLVLGMESLGEQGAQPGKLTWNPKKIEVWKMIFLFNYGHL